MGTSVFIVDDHYMVIEGIRSLLSSEDKLEWAGHASSAASCLAYLYKHQPDVILLDISLPDKSGIDLCKEILAKYPNIRILGLSTFNQQSFIKKMMESGASGYILKNASREEIVEAILKVMRGQKFFSEEALLSLNEKHPVDDLLLTRREQEVLLLIAEGLTNGEIAKRLFISITTVDTHRKNLLTKFESKNTAALIRKATQMGII